MSKLYTVRLEQSETYTMQAESYDEAYERATDRCSFEPDRAIPVSEEEIQTTAAAVDKSVQRMSQSAQNRPEDVEAIEEPVEQEEPPEAHADGGEVEEIGLYEVLVVLGAVIIAMGLGAGAIMFLL